MAKKVNANTDHFPYLNNKQLLALKTVLSKVNSTCALRFAQAFEQFLLDKKNNIVTHPTQVTELHNEVMKPAGSNGFDIHIKPVGGIPGIIAELKCNVPAGKNNNYDGAQRQGIKNDIKNMTPGSNKCKTYGITNNYYRFMVLLDDGTYQAAISTVLNLPSSAPLALYNPNSLNKNHIFVVPIRL